MGALLIAFLGFGSFAIAKMAAKFSVIQAVYAFLIIAILAVSSALYVTIHSVLSGLTYVVPDDVAFVFRYFCNGTVVQSCITAYYTVRIAIWAWSWKMYFIRGQFEVAKSSAS